MGQLVFQATLGGQVNLVGPNTASTFNINVPAIAGTLVTTGDTGTVTNTMLASSAYTAPGTIGSGTPNTGAFTTLSASGTTTLSGNQVISVTDNTNAALRITQLGTGNALLVEDSSNPDSTPFVIDASGQVIAGNTASVNSPNYAGTQIAATMQVQAAAAYDGISLQNYVAGSGGAGLTFAHSRSGVLGTQTVINSGDNLGTVVFSGSDGTAFIRAAQIYSEVDGTPGTNDMPGRLIFSTTADGASSPTERMRIDSAGGIGIGSTSLTGYTLRIGKTITGATAAYSIAQIQTVQSDVTTGAYGKFSSIGTAAAAFTLPFIRHNHAEQGTFGASSTVTNQYGYFADSSLTGATNNFGFYSNIASGTGRYNFYASGTAQNWFSGDVLIGGAGGLGYTTGSGGSVTQATSRTTGVTINKTNGAITLFTAAGLITATTFTVTNSTVAATDVINVCQKSGTNLYKTLVTAVAAGSFNITFYTTGGVASDAPVFNFAVTKAVTA